VPTSDEDLQAQAEKVEKLRQQVVDADANRENRERELSNDIAMTQLQAEEAALQARLAVAKESGKVASVKAGADAPLSAAKDQLARAVAQQKAAEKDPSNAAPISNPVTTAPVEEITQPETATEGGK